MSQNSNVYWAYGIVSSDTDPRPIIPRRIGKVVEIPQVGGLHHRYERLAGQLRIGDHSSPRGLAAPT